MLHGNNECTSFAKRRYSGLRLLVMLRRAGEYIAFQMSMFTLLDWQLGCLDSSRSADPGPRNWGGRTRHRCRRSSRREMRARPARGVILRTDRQHARDWGP